MKASSKKLIPAVAAAAVLVTAPSAYALSGGGRLHAAADSYHVRSSGTLVVTPFNGVLVNDSGGALQVISNTNPSHGSLTFNSDGSFRYIPAAGFTGTDTFTYTVANAVHLYTSHVPSLGTFGGVALNGGAFGSGLTRVPGSPDEYYGLEDRGPNVTAPDGNAVEPIPSYDPSIAKFRLVRGNAVLEKVIPLEDAAGHPYSGLVNSQNPTGEVIEDLNGNKLPQDPNGYDSEGLVAMRDGTFWVSDEYGPFLTHFTAGGRAIQRLSPVDGTLPKELVNRVPNRGMEGLTLTPDGSTLVGIMQSSLQQADLNGKNAKNLTPLRIVTCNLRTHAEHEYLYLLDNPKTTSTAVSEIAALSDTTFLVDERDGHFPGQGAYKKLWKIDISGATDVGPASTVPGATYDGSKGGLLIGGKTIENLVLGQDTATSQATLAAAKITVATKALFLDVDALLLSLDPQARFYSHDKIEGVVARNGGRQVVISNDSDFGIDGVSNSSPPYTLHEKVSPTTGQQDNGEYLVIDMTGVSASSTAATSTATVTIHVS
jgi:hypothetical protein